jgi:hypothetical protein
MRPNGTISTLEPVRFLAFMVSDTPVVRRGQWFRAHETRFPQIARAILHDGNLPSQQETIVEPTELMV